eukprot:1152601-Pelagomonas_calceolata.AAC.4
MQEGMLHSKGFQLQGVLTHQHQVNLASQLLLKSDHTHKHTHTPSHTHTGLSRKARGPGSAAFPPGSLSPQSAGAPR